MADIVSSPGGPPQESRASRPPADKERLPLIHTAAMPQALDFYLALGCEVRQAADGWVLLASGPHGFVLSTEPGCAAMLAPREAPQVLVLSTPDVQALACRLVAANVVIELVPGSSLDEIELIDPDRRRVVIRQSVATENGRVRQGG